MSAWVKVVLGCLLVIGCLGAVKASQIMAMIEFANSFPESSETVEATPAKRTTFQNSINVSGEVVAPQHVMLRTQDQGVIVGDVVEAGARVKKGQVLVTLSQDEEQAQLQALLAEIDLATLDNQRNSALNKRGVGSQDARDQARARLRAAKANAAALQARIDRKTITAPFDGVIGLHRLAPGHFMHVGDLVVSVVGAGKQLWIDFKVGQSQLQPVLGGQVRVTVPGNENSWQGKVISVDQGLQTDVRTRTYRAVVDSHGDLSPGMYVRVSYQAGEKVSVFEVPSSAVRASATGMHVYNLVPAEAGADGPLRANKIAVSVVHQRGGVALVTGALSVDMTIASNGSFKLDDNKLAFIGEPRVAQ